MSEYFSIIKSLLEKKDKREVTILILMTSVGMFFEAIGIAAVIPVITIIIDPLYYNEFIDLNKINFFQSLSHIETVIIVLLSFLIFFIIKTILLAYILYSQNRLLQNIGSKTSIKLYTRYLFRPYIYHLNRELYDIIKNLQTEIPNFISFLRNYFNLFVEIPLIIAIIITVIIIEPTGSIFLIALFGLFFLVYYFSTKHKLKKWGELRLNLDKEISKGELESLNGIREVKLNKNENYFLEFLERLKFEKANISANFQTLTQLPRFFLEVTTITCIFCLVILMLFLEKSTLEITTVLGVFAAAAFRFIPSINRILASVQNVKYHSSSLKKIYHEVNHNYYEPSVKNYSKKNSEKLVFKNLIEIRNLDFKYDKKEILRNLNFKIKKNETIGIIGESGSGKSTFFNLLSGLLHPKSGDIIVDGVSIYSDLEQWNKILKQVSQETFLFDESIAFNISFGKNDNEIDYEKLNNAINNSHLSDFIDSLPDGVNTIVGERGSQLSGGQKQRIGIARAIYNDPKVLIFDESTSSLDSQSEEAIMNTIRTLKSDKTMIIISHRKSSLKFCDKIYKIDNGKISLIKY